MALMKLCRCGKAIEYAKKYCSECEKKVEQKRKDYYKHYDTNCRNKRAAAFYNSREWEKTRDYVLKKYKGLDLYAFFIEKKVVYAETVHHIEELRENWNRRLDIANLFPLSNSNHSKIHKMYLKRKERTQKLLFELLERWNKEYEGVGGV